jgi:hypothetical protein
MRHDHDRRDRYADALSRRDGAVDWMRDWEAAGVLVFDDGRGRLADRAFT